MKQSQREVVAILVPPLSNSLPRWGESTEFPSPSPLKGEDKVRVKSFEGITRSGHSLKRKNMYSILTKYM